MRSFFSWLLVTFVAGLGWAAFVFAFGVLARLNWELFMLGWGLL